MAEKPPVVDKLLANMADELQQELTDMDKSVIGPENLPSHFTNRQKFIALGFQQPGLDFIRQQGQGKVLLPLPPTPTPSTFSLCRRHVDDGRRAVSAVLCCAVLWHGVA